MLSMIDPGLPRKVLQRLDALGVHADCIASQDPCSPCMAAITAEMDVYYGDIPTSEELLLKLVDDLIQDWKDRDGSH